MQNPIQEFVGIWATEEEDSLVIFEVAIENGHYVVSGFDKSDGEKFEISNVSWNGQALYFEALMPSTQTKSKNAFRLLPDGKAELELTIYETWKKIPPLRN